ncbi:MAG: hypothetical protein KME32_26675 [Mojavia pulchra JT2-VF2]|jgi:hypothetical protein|uniref:Calcium-binding protein n=1 Tax=Mojavia pulchra JT2-VF2 TaxID=287848 RepID=A0A951Q5R0_9NOST|nr:hypothetical protein [Mojavia pulchra JT2-VF2]
MSKLIVPPNIIGTNQSDLVQGVDKGGIPSIGIEVLINGIIDTRLGNDTITGEGQGFYSSAIGISNDGTIKTGLGNDTIAGTGEGGSIPKYIYPGIGIFNSTTGIISAGLGNDTITGTGEGGSDNDDSKGIGISNQGKISTDAGNDNIKGIGTGGMYSGDGIGILSSGSVDGGTGNDSLIGTGSGNTIVYGGVGGQGIGISNTGKINGNAGKDDIIGTGTGGDGPGNGGKGIGIQNTGSISGGSEDDLITGIGKGSNSGGIGGDGIGIANTSDLGGGDGSDVLTGIGIGGKGGYGANGHGVGISNTAGRISAGNGNDQILGYGTSVGIEGNGVNVVGIDGGVGDDLFKARKISGLDAKNNPIESANQNGSVSSIFISGGKGKDIFDVGFGTAKLSGGQDYDTLILPILAKGTYTIGKPDVNGWLQITNTASVNVLSVSSIEHILSGGVTLLNVS